MRNTKTNTMSGKLLVLAAVVLAVLCLFAGCSGAKSEAGGKAYTLTVVDAEGNETVHELTTDEEMLGAALLNEGLIEGSESEYGLFVTKVDGIEADSANEEWWCLTKGGEMVMTGVDSTPVEDGDAFEFTLTVGY
ncbi:MAG: DUF4430 domain-containing protein [Hominenteromicrobium sp.]